MWHDEELWDDVGEPDDDDRITIVRQLQKQKQQ